MTQPVLLKVYGNLSPASSGLAAELGTLTAQCLSPQELPIFTLDGELLLISYEGLYFPLEECLAIIKTSGTLQGKLDYLDLEKWQLTRYVIARGQISAFSAPLNNVLDYSGH